jgi:hypothetical protein
MHGEHETNWEALKSDKYWQQLSNRIIALNDSPELEMDV